MFEYWNMFLHDPFTFLVTLLVIAVAIAIWMDSYKVYKRR